MLTGKMFTFNNTSILCAAMNYNYLTLIRIQYEGFYSDYEYVRECDQCVQKAILASPVAK